MRTAVGGGAKAGAPGSSFSPRRAQETTSREDASRSRHAAEKERCTRGAFPAPAPGATKIVPLGPGMSVVCDGQARATPARRSAMDHYRLFIGGELVESRDGSRF